MTSNLVARLRALAGCYSAEESSPAEAADEIERLTAALKQATCSTCNGRGVIGGILDARSGYQTDPCPDCGTRDEAVNTSNPKLPRYTQPCVQGQPGVKMDEVPLFLDPRGKWVRYVDANAEIERLRAVFEEACNEVKMSHNKPCFCKYCF